MFSTEFDERTRANMDVALRRACERIHGEDHATRKMIAEEILNCAREGRTGVSDLTEAAFRAAEALTTH